MYLDKLLLVTELDKKHAALAKVKSNEKIKIKIERKVEIMHMYLERHYIYILFEDKSWTCKRDHSILAFRRNENCTRSLRVGYNRAVNPEHFVFSKHWNVRMKNSGGSGRNRILSLRESATRWIYFAHRAINRAKIVAKFNR